MSPNYFDFIFVHPRQKARLRPELSPKFLSTLGSNPKSSAQLTTLEHCLSLKAKILYWLMLKRLHILLRART